jgi:hypothetical protein
MNYHKEKPDNIPLPLISFYFPTNKFGIWIHNKDQINQI